MELLFRETVSALSNRLKEDHILRESMFGGKKAMLIGTYHMTPTIGDMNKLKPLIDRMRKFVSSGGVEVRFELALPHKMVDESLLDAMIYREIEHDCTAPIKGLDNDDIINKLLPELNKISNALYTYAIDACNSLGISEEVKNYAERSLYDKAFYANVVNCVLKQKFGSLDIAVTHVTDLDVILERAMAVRGYKYNTTMRSPEIVSKYNDAASSMDEVIGKRDVMWDLPMTEKVLICVGYEHIERIRNIYKKKGYTILT